MSSNTTVKDFNIGDKVTARSEHYGHGIRTVVRVVHRPNSYSTVQTTPVPENPTIFFSPEELVLVEPVEVKSDTLDKQAAFDAVLAHVDQEIHDAEKRLQLIRDVRSELIRLA